MSSSRLRVPRLPRSPTSCRDRRRSRPQMAVTALTFCLVLLSSTGLPGRATADGTADPTVLTARPVIRLAAFLNASATHLPPPFLVGRSMDAGATDVDGDGDLDIVVAKEFGTNVLLLGDGTGHFTDASAARFPRAVRDSEEVALGDFDRDGDVDLVFVSEDDFVNEYYLNDGRGFFTDAGARLPVTGESNAVQALDVDGDEDLDLVIGNAGQDFALINDGAGNFADETSRRLPVEANITQDFAPGDIDGDGDLDLVQGNEDGNRLWLNDGSGVFTDATAGRLPLPPAGEETRRASLGDVDGDGDLDLYLANVRFGQQRDPQDRLLVNDGRGRFTDVSRDWLPPDALNTVDGHLVDLDFDGALDLVRANAFGGGYEIFQNERRARFVDRTAALFPPTLTGDGIDVESADFNGDGALDLFLTNYAGPDRLLLGQVRYLALLPIL